MIREFKASTKQGQNIIERARVHEGVTLQDVYGSHSKEKESSWWRCYDLFLESELRRDFHICSHNTFQYSVAWECVIDDEDVLRVETANNSYLVWLER